MRISDHLYFAPSIRFSEVDLRGTELPNQFESRIRGFYLDPAVSLAKAGQGFASGVLLVVTIDAIARIASSCGSVRDRIRDWCKNNVPGLPTDRMRDTFYDDFRNGLVHEARVKNGGEFDLALKKPAGLSGPRLIVNPRLLADEVLAGLRKCVEVLNTDKAERRKFTTRIRSEFEFELTR